MATFFDRVRAFLKPSTAKDATTSPSYGGFVGGFRLASTAALGTRRHATLRSFADRCEPARTAINWRKQQVAESRYRIVRTDDPKRPPSPAVVKAITELLREVNPSRLSFSE